MHKNAKKDERITQSEISCHYTYGCSMVKIGHLDDSFLDIIILNASKPGRRRITAAKRKAKEKKERGKTNFKIRKA